MASDDPSAGAESDRREAPDEPPGRPWVAGCDVLVVGGGPAGLAAADALAGRGVPVTVVERSSRLGGMAASVTVDGVRVDLGSHRLHPVAPPAVERLIGELLGGELQLRPRHGRIRLLDRWIRFPLRPVDLVRRLPAGVTAGLVADTLVAPWRARRLAAVAPGTAADSFAGVVERDLGPTMLEVFYGPYAAKLWGRPAEQLAGELARRRIAHRSTAGLAAGVLRRRPGGPPLFRYPQGGYGRLVEALADRAASRGARLLTGRAVRSLRRSAPSGGWSAVLSDGTSFDVGRVFWTAPPDVLRSVLDGRPAALDAQRATGDAPPNLPPGAAPAEAHRAVVCAYLTVDRPRVTPFDAHYLPGPELLASRISEPKNYRDGPDPADRTVLCAELPCDVGDGVWTAGPGELADRLGEDLQRAGMAVPVTGCHVERLARVYPVFGPGDVAARRRRDEWAQSIDGIAVFGRQGFGVADNIHHVLAMALDAVGCLSADGRWDTDGWAAARGRFEGHVVQD